MTPQVIHVVKHHITSHILNLDKLIILKQSKQPLIMGGCFLGSIQ